MKFRLAALVAACLLTQFAKADLVIQNPAERTALISNAKVWLSPSWISSDFQFSPTLDVYNGPAVSGNWALVLKDYVHCLATPEISTQKSSASGRTPKFYCQLMGPDQTGVYAPLVKANGTPEKIKVKYIPRQLDPNGRANEEIYGEVLGTRLLWALGFAADRMFYVRETHCHGCTLNPFSDRHQDPTTLKNPRVFSPTAIEKKFSGEAVVLQESPEDMERRDPQATEPQIKEGVSFKELMRNFSTDPTQKYYQYRDRDALRLLAVFMQHKDVKAANHRLVCPEINPAGKCVGQPIMMIQDIGSSFGVGVKNFSFFKVDFNRFKSEPVWKDPAKCQGSLTIPFLPDPGMSNPIISESGRKFLAQLLEGFMRGPEGRERVKAIFRAAHIEERGLGETVEMWTDAFIARAETIIHPMGAANPNFACPQ